jgi:hypothetical protein
VIEEVIVANSDAINQIKNEISKKKDEDNVMEEADTNEKEDVMRSIIEKQKEMTKISQQIQIWSNT